MAAKIQFRRGMEADRASVVADAGEPLWASDDKALHIGDGSTPGGIAVLMASLAGSIGLNVLAATTQAEARNAIGLGTSDGPTFAGLTTTGEANIGRYCDVIHTTNADLRGVRIYGQSDGLTEFASSLAIFTTGEYRHTAGYSTYGGFHTFYTDGTLRASIGSTGIATLYGSAPGTAGAGEVLIGGGQINAAGAVTASGFAATADTNGVYNFLAPRNTNAGSSAYTLSYWGNDTSAVEGYIILNSSTNTALAGAGSFNAGGAKSFGLLAGGAVRATVTESASAEEMHLYLYDASAATLKRVSRGAADSGGTGYRVLRIPN